MASGISNNALVVQSSGHPAQGGLVERIAEDIFNCSDPDYPDGFITTINQFTGVLKHTIIRLSVSIHKKPQNAQIIKEMIRLMIAKVSIGRPNGNGDFVSLLQTFFHDKGLPSAFDRMNAELSRHIMPHLDCGKRPYAKYSSEWRKRLNIIIWGTIGFRLIQYVKQQAQS